MNLTCILIDPFACEVCEIEIPKADDRESLAPYYAALSHETMPVSLFEAVRTWGLRGHDVLFVDEEGSFKGAQRYFLHAGFHTPLAGKGLIVGAHASGAAKSADTPLETVKRCVAFLERKDGRLRSTRTPWEAEAK